MRRDDTEALFLIARAWSSRHYPSYRLKLIQLVYTTAEGHPVDAVQLPVQPGEVRPPEDDDDGQPTPREAILQILREAGQRLTKRQILAECERRDWLYGESTLRHQLTDMVREGVLTNDSRADPPGYQAVES